jgi:putative endonuclease
MWTKLLEWTDRVRQSRRAGAENTQAAGRRGEDLAQRYLQQRGCIVGRNWRTRSGHSEVDLIAVDGDVLVFVEVKARRSDEYGAPDRTIGREKERQLARAAREYQRRTRGRWQKLRFDIVSVILTDPPRIEHNRDALRVPFRPVAPEVPAR